MEDGCGWSGGHIVFGGSGSSDGGQTLDVVSTGDGEGNSVLEVFCVGMRDLLWS